MLRERAGEYFTPDVETPYMLLVADTRPEKRDVLPAITHVDGTARVQTVTREQNRLFYDLIARFGEKTGVPVLVNTSFNIRGEPIVCDYGDALDCFLNTEMDRLVIGNCYLDKEEVREKAFRL